MVNQDKAADQTLYPGNEASPTQGIPFPDEIAYLTDIMQKLDTALTDAEENVLQLDREYKKAKQYMVDYRNEMDSQEKLQNELLLAQTDRTGVFAVEMRERVAKLKQSPYFARIDFTRDGSKTAAAYYIGRFGFTYKNENLIFDWRAPISGMFYDYDLGRAGFDAPVGRIEGELTRKRQFKIENGIMEYVLESATNVQDDILQKELAHTSDEKMKSIISTIQREQNIIIRNERAKTLIILDFLSQQINRFEAGKNASLGIVTKTNTDAKNLFELLSQRHKVNLLTTDSTQFSNGISITSIQMAKGLEFDEVIVPNVSNTQYDADYDRNLLYIACTRAMHKLTLSYTGQPSRFLTLPAMPETI